MCDRDDVLSRHPQATLREDPNLPVRYRWVVLYQHDSGLKVGGGPTPDEAWGDAAIHTRDLVAFEARVAARLKGEGGVG